MLHDMCCTSYHDRRSAIQKADAFFLRRVLVSHTPISHRYLDGVESRDDPLTDLHQVRHSRQVHHLTREESREVGYCHDLPEAKPRRP